MAITRETSSAELAAVISQALEAAGVEATLSGGGAVSFYTDNEYESLDLDFVTSASREAIAAALAPLGFTLANDRRHFHHSDTALFVEFPPGPLVFGDRIVDEAALTAVETRWGPLRVITPTMCVMDRLASFWHWNDRQAWDQAIMVVWHATVNRADLDSYALQEGADPTDIDRLYEKSAS